MNTSRKGLVKELQCLKELTQYYHSSNYKVIKSWHTHRDRSGGNDYLDSWDIALLITNNTNTITTEVGIQVKSHFSRQEFNRLNNLWHDVLGDFFLAIYNKQKTKSPNINLPHFQLFSVNGSSQLSFIIPNNKR